MEKNIFKALIRKIQSLFSVRNLRNMFLFLLFMSAGYAVFLLFSPLLPTPIQDKICRGSGFGVIVIMIILVFLLLSGLRLIRGFIVKMGLVGAIGTIFMYSLWLSIDYGSKHPYASATGFNVSEIMLGFACSYLILDKILSHINKNNK